MAKIYKIEDKYFFDEENGTEAVEVKTWLETSKKTANHPDGILWIKLPKGNSTNRSFFSVAKFNEEAVNDECVVPVKTSGPRVLGATGVKQDIIKYLDEETAAEYTELVNNAVDAYKNAKSNNKKKKPEEMTVEELTAYITALQNGEVYNAVVVGPKSFLDMFNDEQYNRYNEILALAQENKANAPKAKRGPLSDEQKEARKVKNIQNKISKAQALLAALRAGSNDTTEDYDI